MLKDAGLGWMSAAGGFNQEQWRLNAGCGRGGELAAEINRHLFLQFRPTLL